MVKYVNARKKVKIICSKHGVFEQVPFSHIRPDMPRGCKKCANENLKGKLLRDTLPPDTPYNIYLARFSHSEGEKFLKVGLTKTSLKQRFYGYTNYDIKELEFKLPVVVRFQGTNSKEGRDIIEIKYLKHSFKITLPFYGMHNTNNFLSASTVALSLGITKLQLLKGIKKFKAVDKRFNIIKINSTILIDDTYNANPDSTAFAIKTVGNLGKNKYKLVVLGDMLELGIDSIKLHNNLAPILKKAKVNEVLTIGSKTKYLNNALKSCKIVNKHFSKRDALQDYLYKKDFSNSVILIKGSRGMKMEQFSKIIEEGIK
ncbi:MAG: hypothetical protein IH949_12905 [Bacteroidetes bacterium]|nr:hypothetical protein [Bacteroidota bacterium]